MRTPIRELIAGALATGALACGAFTTYQTAEPLPRGRWQVAGALGPGLYVDRPGDTRTVSGHVEVAVRRGLGADTDAGLRLYGLGAEASVRHRVLRRGAWSGAGLLALGGIRTTGQGALPDALAGQVRLTGALTWRASPAWALTGGPVVSGGLYLPAAGGHATGVLLGVAAGAERRLGGCWRLHPELSLHRTVAGDVPVDGAVVQLGLGVSRDL